MIPNISLLSEEITNTVYPNRTYKVVLDADRINGYTDDLDAVSQAVYFILSSERYNHIIYSWDYGIEVLDLFGKPMSYVMSELQNRVKDALTQDDRVTDVVDFEFEKRGTRLYAKFTVKSKFGNFDTGLEVEV